MAKTETKQGQPARRAATRAFERAWKLLGRLEKRLAAAREEESKRRRQLAAATGDEIARRQAQVEEASANAARVAGLLTELSEMIAANARAQAGQTVSDFAHAAADAVRDEARAQSAADAARGGTRPARDAGARPGAARPATAATAATAKPAARPTIARPASARRAPAKPAVVKSATVKPDGGQAGDGHEAGGGTVAGRPVDARSPAPTEVPSIRHARPGRVQQLSRPPP